MAAKMADKGDESENKKNGLELLGQGTYRPSFKFIGPATKNVPQFNDDGRRTTDDGHLAMT